MLLTLWKRSVRVIIYWSLTLNVLNSMTNRDICFVFVNISFVSAQSSLMVLQCTLRRTVCKARISMS